MVRVMAAIYAAIHRIVISIIAIASIFIGVYIGKTFSREIAMLFYNLFGWRLTSGNTVVLCAILGFLISIAYCGREAMLLEIYKSTKEKT